MRSSQDFTFRYPLIEVEGNNGSLMASGSWASPRYTGSRLSALASCLFKDLEKETIDDWRENYDGTEDYPSVLPTKGFYNIVNGTQGIGIGAASSCPQYNLKEVNKALIKLLWNKNISFDEIYCIPDFATGGVLLNEQEVKESMKNGTGKACILRSVVSYDSAERCLIVNEIPFGVYTNTICGELEEIINGAENPGIDRFNDLTGSKPLIKIYLKRQVNPERILQFLYKKTSLQYHFGINFTMLDQGRYPKVFGWKELLQSYLDHQIIVYTRGYEYEVKKIEERLHIIEGLLIAVNNIDEVISIIKNSSSAKEASTKMREKFFLSEKQTKAILDIKLARLAKLEVNKIVQEQNDLTVIRNRILDILHDEKLLKKEIEKDLSNIASTFGDGRRTQVLNLSLSDKEEVIEERKLSISFTNQGAIFVNEVSSLCTQRRNGVGNKFKLENGEYVVNNLVSDNSKTVLLFTNTGRCYPVKLKDLLVDEKQYVSALTKIKDNEFVRAVTVLESGEDTYVVCVTKNGYIKKTKLSEYNTHRTTGTIVLGLGDGDEISKVLFLTDEKIGILSRNSHFIITDTKDINEVGRTARGVIGIRLKDGDRVVDAHIIDTTSQEIIFVTKNGLAKRTPTSEFKVTGRGTVGGKVQKKELMAGFLPLTNPCDVLITSNSSQIRVTTDDIKSLSKEAIGLQILKLTPNAIIKKISKI